ncbi:GNAT family N-acetyltransferase, partial [Providencia rettgeri]
YHQTNQKTNTGKTLKPWPILVDHYSIAKLLVAKVVERMRNEGRKIIPLCPFAKAIFDRTPEYSDIRQ